MKRVKLCFQGRETAVPAQRHFAIIIVSSLQRSATTKANVTNHTHTKLGTSVTINSTNKSPLNATSRSTIQEIPAYHKDGSFIFAFTIDQR
jgi:hypothetical protein